MEELQVIETTTGRQFKPWATKDDIQDPASVTALASEIASGKQAIAEAINAKGGSASATESFSELAQDIQDTPTSGVLSSGIVQSEPFSFMDYVCKQGAYPFTEIDDNSVTIIDRESGFSERTNLLKVKMTALGTISGGNAFRNCSALQEVNMPNLTTINGERVFYQCYALKTINMPNLTTITGSGTFYRNNAAQEINLPNLTTITHQNTFQEMSRLRYCYLPSLIIISQSQTFRSSDALKELQLGTVSQLTEPFYNAKPNLRNLTIGQDTNINLPFQQWTATNVIAEGQSGIDELNANLQTNLISKLYQGGGKILRLGTTLYDVTTQETRDMVTAKGWTLQRG